MRNKNQMAAASEFAIENFGRGDKMSDNFKML